MTRATSQKPVGPFTYTGCVDPSAAARKCGGKCPHCTGSETPSDEQISSSGTCVGNNDPNQGKLFIPPQKKLFDNEE